MGALDGPRALVSGHLDVFAVLLSPQAAFVTGAARAFAHGQVL